MHVICYQMFFKNKTKNSFLSILRQLLPGWFSRGDFSWHLWGIYSASAVRICVEVAFSIYLFPGNRFCHLSLKFTEILFDVVELFEKCAFDLRDTQGIALIEIITGDFLWWILLPKASFGLRVLSLPASVSVCVRPCVNHKLVRAITHHQFQLGSPNLDQRCKSPRLRSLLFCGTIDRDLQGQIELQSRNLPHFKLFHAITHHQLKLQFPNLEQKCI